MLQKLTHRIRGLQERETLEVAQSDVDATKLAYHVRQGTNDTGWLPSKIVVDLGHIEVLKTATRGNSHKCHDSISRDASLEVLAILVAVIQHMEGLLGDPVISAHLGKDLVKWVVVEDILQDWIYVSQNDNSLYENDK
jgi:hypothetical protein